MSATTGTPLRNTTCHRQRNLSGGGVTVLPGRPLPPFAAQPHQSTISTGRSVYRSFCSLPSTANAVPIGRESGSEGDPGGSNLDAFQTRNRVKHSTWMATRFFRISWPKRAGEDEASGERERSPVLFTLFLPAER
ncbi:hypothetical protein GWI33_015206 [Rhynchophorus ferrugineus]|uniref:Uncharacterized protein n=1 Tax=Rhynchophorus ferrugineus TaxID=354439 RepID=A0A834I074_RHYFE|nr:hypothetical protein GWI33_015206 [Rhynchophorus ferrugineus]